MFEQLNMGLRPTKIDEERAQRRMVGEYREAPGGFLGERVLWIFQPTPKKRAN